MKRLVLRLALTVVLRFWMLRTCQKAAAQAKNSLVAYVLLALYAIKKVAHSALMDESLISVMQVQPE